MLGVLIVDDEMIVSPRIRCIVEDESRSVDRTSHSFKVVHHETTLIQFLER